jgi:hypothetical protein
MSSNSQSDRKQKDFVEGCLLKAGIIQTNILVEDLIGDDSGVVIKIGNQFSVATFTEIWNVIRLQKTSSEFELRENLKAAGFYSPSNPNAPPV